MVQTVWASGSGGIRKSAIQRENDKGRSQELGSSQVDDALKGEEAPFVSVSSSGSRLAQARFGGGHLSASLGVTGAPVPPSPCAHSLAGSPPFSRGPPTRCPVERGGEPCLLFGWTAAFPSARLQSPSCAVCAPLVRR